MAEPEAPSKGKGLGKRVGPLPVWGWAVIIVGGFLGIMIVRKYAGGGAAQGLNVGGVGQPTSSDPGASAPPGVSAGDFKSTIDALTKEFTDSQTQLASQITQSNADQAAANKSLGDSLASALTSAVATLQGEINQQSGATAATGGGDDLAHAIAWASSLTTGTGAGDEAQIRGSALSGVRMALQRGDATYTYTSPKGASYTYILKQGQSRAGQYGGQTNGDPNAGFGQF